MTRINHILPNDQFTHIESGACLCNPILSPVEGELNYIHNNMNNLNKNS
jgi:hypothetical protein